MFLMMPNVYHVENKKLETGDSDFLICGLLFRLSKQWGACRDLYSYKFSIHLIMNLMENANILPNGNIDMILFRKKEL